MQTDLSRYTGSNDDRLMDLRLYNQNLSTHMVALPWEDAE